MIYETIKIFIISSLITVATMGTASATGKYCNPNHKDVMSGRLSELCSDGDVVLVMVPMDAGETIEVTIAQACDYTKAIRTGFEPSRNEYFLSCVVELREWRGF